MAWGFPVVCTPQSGYYETPFRKNIYLDDLDKSIKILKQLQQEKESELFNMANEARDAVSKEYTWEKFTNRVIESLFS
jgi:hypothetical protein